jgi:hypothetical protein
MDLKHPEQRHRTTIWTKQEHFYQHRKKRMIPFLQEVMSLCPGNFIDAIHQTIDWIKAEGTPGRQRADFSYARIARAAFEDIRALTASGFSYVAICKAFETNGLLPEGAAPYSLSRAVRREGIRRQKRIEPAKVERLEQNMEKKLDVVKTSTTVMSAQKPESGGTTPDEKTAKMAETKVNTGLGKLTKHADGSFDFDWN